MLSKRGATALSIILSHASFLKVVPFDWNDQKGRLEVVQGVRIYRTIIFGTWVTFLAVFQVSAYILRRGSMSLGQEVLSTLFILVFTLGAGVSLNTFRKRKEFASFSNQFRALQNSLQDAYLIGEGEEFDGFGFLLGTFLTVRFTQSSVSSLLFLLEPGSPRYVYAHIQDFVPPYTLLFFWALEWLSYVILWHLFLPSFVLFLSYTHATAEWLQQMTIRPSLSEEKLRTSHRLRVRGNSLRIYKRLVLLNADFNDVFASLLIPWLYVIILLTPGFGNYLLIKKRQEAGLTALVSTSIISTVSVSIIILIAFRKAAKVNALSLKFLELLGGRAAKAIPPIRIEIGCFAYFGPTSVIRTIKQIIIVTIAFLLIL